MGLNALSPKPAAVPGRAKRQSPVTSWKQRRGLHLIGAATDATGEPNTQEAERSDMVTEQLLLFIFQMELDTQLQRALNMEVFEVAKQIRERREQLDSSIAEFEESKQGRSGTATTSSVDIRDTVSEGLLLRSELQRAVEEEDYAEAARIRDELAKLEEGASALQATVEAERWDTAQPLYEIGQRFVHASKGYQGVIVGWDRTCCEDDEWRKRAEVSRLARRENQPFYHVLVDQKTARWSGDDRGPVAYVAEELVKVPKGKSWSEVHGSEEVAHPFIYLLFFGMDAQGCYIPTTALRESYGQERRDVYAPGAEEEYDDDDDDEGSGGDDGLDDGGEPRDGPKEDGLGPD